jgi:hypothetical protein
MEEQNKKQFYLTSDMKLSAFLRLMVPESFVGLNNTNPQRINFVFKQSAELRELINGYISGKQYHFSPLAFATNIEQGKQMIFGEF